MASQNNLNAVFTDIANAIRDKKGSVDTIKPINMADEILTIGDTNFKDLVERTITTIDDDTITKVGQYAFYNCKNLTTADLKSATDVFQYAFEGCSSLTTLILRKNQVCTLSNTNALNGTPIATSTTEGYIYVPLSLVENYRNATNWTTYKSKIIPIDLLEGNYEEVDLGTLYWSYNTNLKRFVSNTITFPHTQSYSQLPTNIVCSKYALASNSQLDNTSNDKIIGTTDKQSSFYIIIRDTSYTDPTTFKNAMSGVILRYLPKE